MVISSLEQLKKSCKAKLTLALFWEINQSGASNLERNHELVLCLARFSGKVMERNFNSALC
jgi:hypothetical protein